MTARTRPVIALRCLAAVLVAVALGARAEAVRLDDSLSHTVPPRLAMEWRPLGHLGGDPRSMEAWLRVQVRLRPGEWAGRRGRVHMVLPSDALGSPVEAVWSTEGRLLPGRLLSGERALVYAGPFPAGLLEDLITVRLRAAPDWVADSRRLNFHFEFEAE